MKLIIRGDKMIAASVDGIGMAFRILWERALET